MITYGPSAALDFVLHAIRTGDMAGTLSSLDKLLSTGLSPSSIQQTAYHHQVSTVVFQTLSEILPLTSEPVHANAVHSVLKSDVLLKWVARWAKLRCAMDSVTTHFTSAKIDCATMRGMALSRDYYARPGTRMMNDIDILVRPCAAHLAETALIDGGFRYRIKQRERIGQAQHLGQMDFLHVATGIVVDMNWFLRGNGRVDNKDIDIEKLWMRAVRRSGSIFSMAPEDLLLENVRHVVHGHDFSQSQIRCCLDTLAILRRTPNFDWDYFWGQSASCGMRKGATMFFLFMKELDLRADLRIPPEKNGNLFEISSAEARLFFTSYLRGRLAPRRGHRNPLSRIVANNLTIAYRLYIADNLKCCYNFLVSVTLPSESLRATFFEGRQFASTFHEVLAWFSFLFLYSLAGLLLGVCAQTLSSLWRRITQFSV